MESMKWNNKNIVKQCCIQDLEGSFKILTFSDVIIPYVEKQPRWIVLFKPRFCFPCYFFPFSFLLFLFFFFRTFLELKIQFFNIYSDAFCLFAKDVTKVKHHYCAQAISFAKWKATNRAKDWKNCDWWMAKQPYSYLFALAFDLPLVRKFIYGSNPSNPFPIFLSC